MEPKPPHRGHRCHCTRSYFTSPDILLYSSKGMMSFDGGVDKVQNQLLCCLLLCACVLHISIDCSAVAADKRLNNSSGRAHSKCVLCVCFAMRLLFVVDQKKIAWTEHLCALDPHAYCTLPAVGNGYKNRSRRPVSCVRPMVSVLGA